MADELPEAGLFASLRRMAATLLALAQMRLELISLEFEEQFEYVCSVLLWSITAIFFASLTVLLLALTVVIAFWDDHRLLAAGLVTGTFALIARASAPIEARSSSLRAHSASRRRARKRN